MRPLAHTSDRHVMLTKIVCTHTHAFIIHTLKQLLYILLLLSRFVHLSSRTPCGISHNESVSRVCLHMCVGISQAVFTSGQGHVSTLYCMQCVNRNSSFTAVKDFLISLQYADTNNLDKILKFASEVKYHTSPAFVSLAV